MLEIYKQDALAWIESINEELDCLDSTKYEANARKMLAKYHLKAETPTNAFCAQVASQKKKSDCRIWERNSKRNLMT